MRRFLVAFACSMLVGIAAGSAFAQRPQSTTATYGDWVLRCDTHGAAKFCEMTQSTQLKGQTQPITQIAIGRQGKNGPLKIVFQVPINVWLASGVALATDDGHSLVTANFSRCVPAGCIADTDIKESVTAKLREQKKNGTLRFKSANKQDVAAPVSFKGFGDAYDALQQ
jgi:invasion protein IalB